MTFWQFSEGGDNGQGPGWARAGDQVALAGVRHHGLVRDAAVPMSPRDPHRIAGPRRQQVQGPRLRVDVLDHEEDLQLPEVLRIEVEELGGVRLQRLVGGVEQVDPVEDRQPSQVGADQPQHGRMAGQRHHLGVQGTRQLRRGHEQLAGVVAARAARIGEAGAGLLERRCDRRPGSLTGHQDAGGPIHAEPVERRGGGGEALQQAAARRVGVGPQLAAQGLEGQAFCGRAPRGDRLVVAKRRPRLEEPLGLEADGGMNVGRGEAHAGDTDRSRPAGPLLLCVSGSAWLQEEP